MKICALLVPKEMKVEHAGGLKTLADELRIGHQSQDRQSAGSGSSADAARPRRRGDRMINAILPRNPQVFPDALLFASNGSCFNKYTVMAPRTRVFPFPL